jgi:transposase-like protein
VIDFRDVGLTEPYLQHEVAAVLHLEAVVWGLQPLGMHRPRPVCWFCCERIRIVRCDALPWLSRRRVGAFWCKACHRTFHVTNGTIMAKTRYELHKWLSAIRLITMANADVPSLRQRLGMSHDMAVKMSHTIRRNITDDRFVRISADAYLR